MKIEIHSVDLKYAWTAWHSVGFTIPGRKKVFVVTVAEMYDANSDSSTFELTCAEGDLTNKELLELEPILITAVEEEKE